MVKKVRVGLFGFQRRNIMIDADATEGAKVGKNLFWPDGTVVEEDEIRGGGTSTTVEQQVYPTIWDLVFDLPDILKSIGSLVTNGWMRHDNGVVSTSRQLYTMDRIETGDNVTIPVNNQMIVMDEFTFDGGSLTIDGKMYVLSDQPIQGWRDLEGQIDTRSGANNPDWTIIGSGPFYAYSFDYTPQESECFITFHVPHDIASDTIHFHTHWMTSGTVTNTVKWELTYTFA